MIVQRRAEPTIAVFADDDAPDMGARGPLAGKVVVVTGAGRGIGRAIARELARAGATVAIVDICADGARDTQELIAGVGGRATAYQCDVTQASEVATTISMLQASLGPVDVLVNNVGGTRSVGPVAESDPEAWWRDVELNLLSAYLCSRAVLPTMVERRAGRIVNVASNGAFGVWPMLSAYASAKAALVSFTRALAAEVAPFGIGVFALHPGYVHTRLVDDIARCLARYGGDPVPRGAMPSADAAARLTLQLVLGRADHLSGHFFADATDDLRRLGWRSLARLGLIRRDLAAWWLLRQPSRAAWSARPPRTGGIRHLTRMLRNLLITLVVGLPAAEWGMAAAVLA